MSTIDQERAADCIDGIVEAVFTNDAITAVDFDEGDAAAIAIDLGEGRRRAVVVVYPAEGDAAVHAVDDSVTTIAEQLRTILVAGGERAFTALVIQLLGDDVVVGFAHDDDHEGGWPLANARDDLLIEALRPRAEDLDDADAAEDDDDA